MIDLKGRNIRTSAKSNPEEGVFFDLGAVVNVKCKNEESSEDCLQIDNENIPKAVRPGDVIAFNDGQLGAVILEVSEDTLKIQFKEMGTVYPG